MKIRRVLLWLGIALGMVVVVVSIISTSVEPLSFVPDTETAAPSLTNDLTANSAANSSTPVNSSSPAPQSSTEAAPAVARTALDGPKSLPAVQEQVNEPPVGGGVEIIALSGGAQLGCALEVFTCSEPKWPFPLDRAGSDAPPSGIGETILGPQAAAMAQVNHYVGSNGHCLVPSENRVSVSLVVVAHGFDMQSFDDVGLAPPGEAPKRLSVELTVGHSSVIIGRVVDDEGHSVSSAHVIGSARHPLMPWRVRHSPGPIPRIGGDQFRAFLEISDKTDSDGGFQLAPLLPSEDSVVRVFVGDILVASRKKIHTLSGKTTFLDPIVIPRCRVVTMRLLLDGRYVRSFRTLITGGIATPETTSASGGTSHTYASPAGEVRVPVRAEAPTTIKLMVNDQEGRFSLLHRPNMAFYRLVMASHGLVNQVLAREEIHVDSGADLADDVTIRLDPERIAAALGTPAIAAALAAISESLADSSAAPKDLLEAARLATGRSDLLPLLRLMLEPVK